MSNTQYALKMRQSLAQFEQAFHHEAEEDQRRREHNEAKAQWKRRKKAHEMELQRRSVRFYVLAFSLISTAVIVTVVMLATLYILLV
ncbi:MAG: hypothetical protein J2O48_12125 [Solirubrobacterales bacterium]|nr:hypothetical protein [Solirubrobacterales bacterium]